MFEILGFHAGEDIMVFWVVILCSLVVAVPSLGGAEDLDARRG